MSKPNIKVYDLDGMTQEDLKELEKMLNVLNDNCTKYRKENEKLQQEKENLIKYLEESIEEWKNVEDEFIQGQVYEDRNILEKVKKGEKYE